MMEITAARLAERLPAAERIIAKPFDLDEVLAGIDALLRTPAGVRS